MKPVTLEARDLAIGYRRRGRSDVRVAEDLNLDLLEGELVCLLGGNGVGKSTLLRSLAGLHPVLGGAIRLQGRPVDKLGAQARSRLLAVVLTDRPVAGHLSVLTLVGLGRYPYTGVTGRISEEDRAKVQWALDAVNGGHLAGRYYDELSDGERQKVMIARALAQDPSVMLLDEPTAFLDLTQRMEIARHLRDLARDSHRTVLLTTHDVDLALRAADRIWLMQRGGTICVGAPEDLILDGSLPRVFCDEHVVFDEQLGSFALQEEGGPRVVIEGEGRPVCWTERALRRAGFQLGAEGEMAPYRVTLTGSGAQPGWRVEVNGTREAYGSILQLVDGMRRIASKRDDFKSKI